jgi:hypothetical protein
MHSGHRLQIGLAAAAVACASSAAALAATGYAINKISVPKNVEQKGKAFNVTVKGTAKNLSALDVFLDYRKCPASETKEGKRDSIYKAGYSYFVGPSSVSGVAVKGSFTQSFTAHTGTITGRQYVCAYLTTSTTPIRTRAHASASYKVTK